MTLEQGQPTFADELPEVPAAYTHEEVKQYFDLDVIKAIDTYQRSTPVEQLVRQPLPEAVTETREYRPFLPVLTYNVGRHPEAILQAIKRDPVFVGIKGQPDSKERPRALRTRRTVVAFLLNETLDTDVERTLL